MAHGGVGFGLLLHSVVRVCVQHRRIGCELGLKADN